MARDTLSDMQVEKKGKALEESGITMEVLNGMCEEAVLDDF